MPVVSPAARASPPCGSRELSTPSLLGTKKKRGLHLPFFGARGRTCKDVSETNDGIAYCYFCFTKVNRVTAHGVPVNAGREKKRQHLRVVVGARGRTCKDVSEANDGIAYCYFCFTKVNRVTAHGVPVNAGREKNDNTCVLSLVPEAGLEPARYFYRGILSPLRYAKNTICSAFLNRKITIHCGLVAKN